MVAAASAVPGTAPGGASTEASHPVRHGEALKQKEGADSLPYAEELALLGANLLEQKRWKEAEAVLRESLAIRQKKEPDIWTTFETRVSGRRLESLEERIDEGLTMARNLDVSGLENVIQLLRRARNEVVWKIGQ